MKWYSIWRSYYWPQWLNAERNRRLPRRRFTVISDRRTFVMRIVVDVPLRAIEIHPEDSEEAVIEHNSRYYSRLWRGTRMLEAGARAGAENPNGHVLVRRSIIHVIDPPVLLIHSIPIRRNERGCERHPARFFRKRDAICHDPTVTKTHKFKVHPEISESQYYIFTRGSLTNNY